ncbi:GNAT family N-acetyltransferase [Roseomonas mucosa]|uniref:N-acetyltransferase domain-containing protein n=1 Tax=Roseomonas mucosa TaxID=207340 RepID=A0A1S8D3J7_9PROT|nr:MULTISPECIES: GNAT family N-acetyltransferase [Roseomonas]MBS5904649.1 GNAT family N-acetyltransferase [Acetobacteraceae bacterium]MCG7352654.1 GNAT family N-acetyltransferase [Roseomonas mucosa]MCG7358195.1 GNAT family N-acetyltransferase [Roseomonas mucosa]MDT8291576.1 GNAT family N-acetyltransferase [Roseomonas mucosa]MDT8295535.1 GNAT family N-acetyltransferase [Roseomonas mucosa]
MRHPRPAMPDADALSPDRALLRLPEEALLPSYAAALAEGLVPDGGGLPPEKGLMAHLRSLNDPETPVRLPDGGFTRKVPGTHFWLAAGDMFIGTVNCRYALTPYLRRRGGHVGYAVRPGLRGRGFATRGLALALAHMRERGFERVLLTCRSDNTPSRRAIERAGGMLEDEAPDAVSGELVRRYWIALRAVPALPPPGGQPEVLDPEAGAA